MIQHVILLLALMPTLCVAEPKKTPTWSEYEACFHCNEGTQPVITIKWFSMDVSGSYQEYPEIWRKGMAFGHGKRFKVETLTGVDYDGIKIKGKVVTAIILDTLTAKRFSFSSDQAGLYKSYSKEWMEQHLLKYPQDNKDAEQDGAVQPATAPLLKSEGKDKPQPESNPIPR